MYNDKNDYSKEKNKYITSPQEIKYLNKENFKNESEQVMNKSPKLLEKLFRKNAKESQNNIEDHPSKEIEIFPKNIERNINSPKKTSKLTR